MTPGFQTVKYQRATILTIKMIVLRLAAGFLPLSVLIACCTGSQGKYRPDSISLVLHFGLLKNTLKENSHKFIAITMPQFMLTGSIDFIIAMYVCSTITVARCLNNSYTWVPRYLSNL